MNLVCFVSLKEKNNYSLLCNIFDNDNELIPHYYSKYKIFDIWQTVSVPKIKKFLKPIAKNYNDCTIFMTITNIIKRENKVPTYTKVRSVLFIWEWTTIKRSIMQIAYRYDIKWRQRNQIYVLCKKLNVTKRYNQKHTSWNKQIHVMRRYHKIYLKEEIWELFPS